jgi:hypothetical protein
MRFIPTKVHAPLDYIVGAALIAAPWIFQFSEHTAATVVPIVLGIGLIAYSLITNYELGVWKVAPDGGAQPDRRHRRRSARGVALALRLFRREREHMGATPDSRTRHRVSRPHDEARGWL